MCFPKKSITEITFSYTQIKSNLLDKILIKINYLQRRCNFISSILPNFIKIFWLISAYFICSHNSTMTDKY